MKRFRFLAGFAVAIAAVVLMGQAAIQTFPPNTVWGRIGVGQYGPGSAIPLSTLLQNLGSGAPAHSVAIGTGSTTGTFNGATTGTSGQILIDQGSGADPAFKPMSGSCTIDLNGVTSCANLGGGTRTVTAATDGITSSDCYKTVEFNYSAGVSMETLPSTSGFPSGCPIWLTNVGSRGVGLVNFPALPSFNQPILYPGLALLIQNIGGSWTPIVIPARYRVNGVQVYVDNVNGCANSGLCTGSIYADGLAPGVGAFRSIAQALGFVYTTVDTIGSYPNILLTAGQVYNECNQIQGQLTGTNVGFIIGNGGNATIGNVGTGCTGATPASFNIGDNAEWEFQNITFSLGSPGFAIFLHQPGVVDILNGVHFNGTASNTGAFGSDHGGFINVQSNSTMNISGTMTVFMALGQGTQVNLGPVQIAWVGTVAMTTFIQISGAGTNVSTATVSFTGTTPVGLVRDNCNGPSMWALNSQSFPGTAGTPAHGCQVF